VGKSKGKMGTCRSTKCTDITLTSQWQKSHFISFYKNIFHLFIYYGWLRSNVTVHTFWVIYLQLYCRSQWPRGLRRRSAAARLLRSWVRIQPGAWKFVCCECCVLSGRRLCDELITRPEESYRLWCVVVCDLETSRMRRQWPALGRSATEKNVNG
jgi:hypothetical protein